MKKFELAAESGIYWCGRTLYRIKACVDFTTTSGYEVKAGELGGYVEKEPNLSHDGNAWVWGNATVCGNAEVFGDAEVYGEAKVCGNASVFSTEHIFCVAPIGEYASFLTLFRTKHLEVKISFEYELYSVEKFKKVIEEWDDTKNREIALAVLEIGQKHIDLTPAVDEYEPCPFCGGKAELDEDSEVVICTECGSTAKEEIWNNRCDG